MSKKKTTRRAFLKGSVAVGSAAFTAGTSVKAMEGDPLITEPQEWAQFTGDGVDATPYGMPIDFESDVVRRNVGWLTADTISSVNFTPIHALDGTSLRRAVLLKEIIQGLSSFQKKTTDL